MVGGQSTALLFWFIIVRSFYVSAGMWNSRNLVVNPLYVGFFHDLKEGARLTVHRCTARCAVGMDLQMTTSDHRLLAFRRPSEAWLLDGGSAMRPLTNTEFMVTIVNNVAVLQRNKGAPKRNQQVKWTAPYIKLYVGWGEYHEKCWN